MEHFIFYLNEKMHIKLKGILMFKEGGGGGYMIKDEESYVRKLRTNRSFIGKNLF